MARSLLVLIVLGVIALSLWGMSRSWKRRIQAGSDIPPLVEAPTDLNADALRVDHATYLGTVSGDHWLDRVAAQGLGHRGPASVAVEGRGLVIERVGADALFIPQAAVSTVELGRGLAGRVYGKEGVIVISWTWGEQILQTGLRIADGHARLAVISALAQLPSGQLWSDLGRTQSSTGEAQR